MAPTGKKKKTTKAKAKATKPSARGKGKGKGKAKAGEAVTGEVVDARPDLPKVIQAKDDKKKSLATYDPLSAYIQETRRYSLITREQEVELAKKYLEEGDKAAGRRLITANLRLVVKIAHEYRKAHQNLLDLIQEGNVGLVQAVQKFDPYRGVKLSTYAAWWIRAYILKFILNNWRMVKIGTTQAQRKLFFNLRKQKEALERKGIEASSANIAKELDVTEKEVVEMERRLAAPDLSLSTPLGKDDSGSRTYYDVLPEKSAPVDEHVAAEQFRDKLSSAFDRFHSELEGREKFIYEQRLMPKDPDDAKTLKQIGDEWGVSRERARQLEKRLLQKMKKYLEEEMGDDVKIAMGWNNDS